MKRLAVVLIVVIFMIQSSFVLALAPLTLNEAELWQLKMRGVCKV